MITGGWLGKTAGILSRKGTLTELSAVIKNGEKLKNMRDKDLDELSGKLSFVNAGLERSKVTLHELQIKQASFKALEGKENASVTDLAARVSSLENAGAELIRVLTETNRELRESREA